MNQTPRPSGSTILDRIVADKREELARRRIAEPVESLQKHIGLLGAQVSLARSLLEGPQGPSLGGKRVQLIAEVKKASPSRGRLVEVLEHGALARTYFIGGAAAISVVTEERHFLGERRFMHDVRFSLDGYYPGARPSVVRKDFLFDPYHLWESRAYGADAVLLITAILSDDLLRDLMQQARELELECLVEVHNEEEIERAVAAGADIIGINNRDLRTFEVDLATTERLRPLIPAEKVVVSESGISTRADVERLAAAGVHAVLVGEALITATNVRSKLRELIV